MSSLRKILAVFIVCCVIGFSLRAVSVDAAANDELLDAAMAGNASVVKNLLANGADVNTKNKKGKTPIEVIGSQNRKEIIDLLKKHGAKSPAQIMRERFQSMSEEEKEKIREQLRKRLDGNKKKETKVLTKEKTI